MTKQSLTQKELKELLHYDPDTGVFRWLSNHGNQVYSGDIAGYLDKTNCYVQIRLNYKLYMAHRLAFLYMTGEFPSIHTDHINHIRNDNRWINLRHITQQENQKNHKRHKDNKSGVMGVGWKNDRNKWRVRISVSTKEVHLGYFNDWFDAVCARKAAEFKYGFHPNHGLM